MANSPRYLGFTQGPYNVTLTDDSGAPLNLTGCTANSFTITLLNTANNTVKQGVGVWSVVSAVAGTAQYQYAPADLNIAGSWLLYVTVKLPAESAPREFDPDALIVLPGTVGAGAAPPGVLPAPAASPLFFNVRDYGAPGDGSDQTTALNNCFSAAALAGGGTVFFPWGLYVYSADLIVPSNVNVLGAGRGSILQAAAGCQANCLKVSNVSHVTISDLQINGNKANVAQIGIQYVSLSGILGQNADDITITRCYIHDCYVSGIMMNGNCTNLQISNNRLLNCFDNQVYVRAKNLSPYNPCSNITITGNICSGGSYSGIQILGSSYFDIQGNICYNNGPTSGQGDGIGSEGASFGSITGNTCYGNGVQGIQTRFTNEVGTAQISSHITIVGNTCYNNVSTGGDNGGIGINDSDDILIEGNLVYANQFGININGGNGNGVTNCKIVNNKVRGNNDTGIRITPPNASTFIVENNESTDNGGDNFYASVRVHVVGGVYARAATNKEGLHFASGSDGSVIKNCEIFDNGDNGILIDSGPANIEIRDSLFDNITTTNQKRAVQEQSGAGPTRMVNCRIKNQATNPYTFNHAQSRYYDEQTVGETTTTTNYSVVANDRVILCNQAAAITVTLPTAANSQGRVILIKDKSGTASTNVITVATTGGQTIDGATSALIEYAFGALELISDGSNWFIIGFGNAQPWALYDGDPFNQSTNTLAANTAYMVGVFVSSYCILTALRCRFGAGAGGANVFDIGIYDGNGNLLAHSGNTATAAGTQTYTLGTPLKLGPGRYWLAFWINNAVDTVTKSNGNANLGVAQSGTTAANAGLPATMASLTGLANGATRPIVMGLLQGGWS